jgi:hypothetical protein
MENNSAKSGLIGKDLIKNFVLIYWILFWLFNILDKIIGGAHFLFVGKDRFAQMQRFFDSIGLDNPIVANIALIITAALEIFALVFFCGALYHFKRRNRENTRSWFFLGILFTLLTFIYFSIGDQIFGDHFELLEHALFYFITLLSWIIFIRIDTIQLFENFEINKKQVIASYFIGTSIAATIIFAIFFHNNTSFIERTQAVEAIQVTENKYKIKFPFLAGSKAFENSISKFKQENPTLSIQYIYTAPSPLRLAESDGLIIYIQAEHQK